METEATARRPSREHDMHYNQKLGAILGKLMDSWGDRRHLFTLEATLELVRVAMVVTSRFRVGSTTKKQLVLDALRAFFAHDGVISEDEQRILDVVKRDLDPLVDWMFCMLWRRSGRLKRFVCCLHDEEESLLPDSTSAKRQRTA